MKKTVLLLICFLFSFTLVACNNPSEDIQDIKVTAINLDENTYEDSYYVGEFSIENIKLIVSYSDNSSQSIDLLEEYIKDGYTDAINTIGHHTINIEYEGLSTTLNIEVVNKYYQIEYYNKKGKIDTGKDETYLKGTTIEELYDPDGFGNDTMWYYDEACTQIAFVPFTINKNIKLYTNGNKLEYINDGIVYRRLQNRTLMAVKDLEKNLCLYIPETVQDMKVTALGRDILADAHGYKTSYLSIIVPELDYVAEFIYEEDPSSPLLSLYTNHYACTNAIYYQGENAPENIAYWSDPDSVYVDDRGTNDIYGDMDKYVGLRPIVKYDSFIKEDDVVYGFIDGKLYLVECLFDRRDSFAVPTTVQGHKVVGIKTYTGLGRVAKKVYIPKEVTEIDEYTLGYPHKRNKLVKQNIDITKEYNTEIYFEGNFADYNLSVHQIGTGFGELSLNFGNDHTMRMAETVQEKRELLDSESTIIFSLKINYVFPTGTCTFEPNSAASKPIPTPVLKG